MFIPRPTREEFRKLAKQGNLIPVLADFFADLETPVSAYAKLAASRPAFLFESVEGGENASRFSFLGCNPRKVFEAREKTTLIHERGGKTQEIPTPQDPLKLVEEEIQRFQPVEIEGFPPFVGGAVGFLSYEYIHRIEPTVPRAEEDQLDCPLIYYAMIDSLVIFDRAHQKLLLCATVSIDEEEDADAAYDRALAELANLAKMLAEPTPASLRSVPSEPSFEIPHGNFKKEDFEKAVTECREYVHSGDVVQVVLSQRFEKEYQHAPIDLYRTLRTINPSPYMFILETGDFALVGASPEVHVRLTGKKVEIRPIAGTRPRGKSAAEDLRMEEDLLADPKERAEHLMLVDLARNDIGRVCSPGSVHVPDFMAIERYSHVMHIVSQVEGELSEDQNAFDLLRATFPAGTVSGAPKVRAMQIIAEKEKTTRGPYSGALGYFSYDGNYDSCIAIRSAMIREGKVLVQSGAGLVADSIPSNEFDETINKARGLLKAVAISEIVEDENAATTTDPHVSR
ncbi:anthranilate synthase component I [Puniceicoccus vermicola]|uniref:Anthranilate synthase component 1 n=1 Tax=Puniceicoccus vermicola TaxID=388746 RepID=A0A7X1E5D7_9BACT|nr:anthranilate synthase component I [Puniceicoccus vermicola]MBC2601492.1 anthranilate synthase component I [Puniceicoccus vermicola]